MADSVISWGSWTFEPAEWRLAGADGVTVSLPNRTLNLLALLLERAPSLVTKDEILAHVWHGSVVEEGNVAFHIAMLRKALDRPGTGPSCIETVRARGYRFVAPVTRSEPPSDPLPPPPDVPPVVTVPAAAAPALTRRQAAAFAPAALLTIAVALLGGYAMTGLEPRLGALAVMPPRIDGEVAWGSRAPTLVASLLTPAIADVQAATWHGPDEGVRDAGRRLSADALLSTRVDRSRSPWRVDVQLFRTRDERRIWAWMFDLPAAPDADADAALASRISAGLRAHLGLAAPAGVMLEAESLVLQGRENWRLRTPHGVQQAIAQYERAIALDPSHARAYAGLADCYNITMSGLPTALRYERAKANVERALALDPNSPEALTSQAFLRYKFEWRWDDAEAGFKRAIALDPSYALARHWYGEFLGLMGRSDEAIAQLREALALDPRSLAIQGDLVPPLLRAGRVDEARAVVEQAAAANPNWYWIPRRRAEVLEAEGRERESLEEGWRSQVLSGASLESVGELRAAYRAGGRRAVLRLEIARLEAAEAAAPGAGQPATWLSLHYARLGEAETAMRWIRVAVDRREDAAIHLLTNPAYDGLRAMPEFTQQLAALGLTPLRN